MNAFSIDASAPFRVGVTVKDSRLDVALKAQEEIPLATLSVLEEAFAESNLPYRVDVVDLQRASQDFRLLVEGNHVRL